MKKTVLYLMTTLMLLTAVPQLKASTAVDRINIVNTTDSAQAQELINRLEEINQMDKSVLSFHQKKELRKEVKTIKHKLRDIGGGVYISAGALILILILLIILL